MVSVSARSYRPPEIEIYHFELTNIATQTEAADLAKDASAATGEKTFVAPDLKTNTWRVRVEKTFETIEEANEFKADLSDKGFEADSNRNNNDALPRSTPEVWNATLIGGDGAITDKQGGLHLRRGTGAKLNNMIVAYFSTFALDVDTEKEALGLLRRTTRAVAAPPP